MLENSHFSRVKPPGGYDCYQHVGSRRRHKGSVLVTVAIGMVAILAVAGLAMDTGNIMLNKTRLQSMVDAAALSAAKTLNGPGGTLTRSSSAASAIFEANAAEPGNEAINSALTDGAINVQAEYSITLDPFAPSAMGTEEYVRITVNSYQVQTYLLNVIGTENIAIGATAVAGPTPIGINPDGDATNPVICNLAPMMVCADMEDDATGFYGYTEGEETVLRSTANTNDVNGNAPTWEVGMGNFQLIQLDEGPGGYNVKMALAGEYEGCLNTSDGIDTEPGNEVGPVVQGLNTRFGSYTGSLAQPGDDALYPPDKVIDQPTLLYSDYAIRYAEQDFRTLEGQELSEIGRDYRRILAIPVGDCSVTTNGQGSVPLVSIGCFFLTRKAKQKGNESEVFGSFVDPEGCPVGGTPEGEPGVSPGGSPSSGGSATKGYKIILYKDPDNVDS